MIRPDELNKRGPGGRQRGCIYSTYLMGRRYVRLKDSSSGHLLLTQPEGGEGGAATTLGETYSQKQTGMLHLLHILQRRRGTPGATRHPFTEHPPDGPVPIPQPPLALLLRRVEPLIIDFLFSLTLLPPLAAVPPNLSGPDRTERCCSGGHSRTDEIV